MNKFFAVGILSLAGVVAASTASAMSEVPHNHASHGASGGSPAGASGSGGGATAAPEIDPASGMSALTLLAGGLLVLRGKRKSAPSQASAAAVAA